MDVRKEIKDGWMEIRIDGWIDDGKKKERDREGERVMGKRNDRWKERKKKDDKKEKRNDRWKERWMDRKEREVWMYK